MNIKDVVGVIAVALLIVGYVPYFRDTVKGAAKPHIFSWFLWGLTALIVFFIRLQNMAGPGAWVNLFAAIVCFMIVFLGFKNGKKYIAKIDYVFLCISLTSLGFWLVADQPLLAMILLLAVDGAAFAPTVRKSWSAPDTEPLFMWCLGVLRHSVGLFAIQAYSLVTTLEPALWAVANGLFILMIIYRRKKLQNVSI